MQHRLFGSCSADARQDELQAEQARLLYATLPSSLLISVVLALLLLSVQHTVIAVLQLALWAGMLLVTLVARFVLLLAWQHEDDHRGNCGCWLRRFRIGVVASGCAWGLGALLLFPHGDIDHQAYLSFVLAGLAAGAVSTLAVDRVSMFGFLTPMLLPLGVHFWQEGGRLAWAMGFMVMLFLVVMVLNASNVRRNLHENIRLRLKAEEQEQRLRESEARLNQAQALAKIGNWELDLLTDTLHWSDEIFRIFEIDPQKFRPSYEAFLNAIHPEDREAVNQAYLNSLQIRSHYEITHRLLLRDGRIKWVTERGDTLFDAAGKPLRSIGTVQDVTKEKHAQEHIEHMAHYDRLTGLPNRALFYDRLKQGMAMAKRNRGGLALMYLDLDGFKQINDTYGHHSGDKLLVAVAERLGLCVRESDTVARLGGDEFTVILGEAYEEQDLARIAEKIVETVSQPFEIDGHSVSVSASIGIARYADDKYDEDDLVNKADGAMYEAKLAGKNTWRFAEAISS